MAPIVTMVGPKTPHGKETVVLDVMQNIKVFVRSRPLKPNEKKCVIEVIPERKEVRINESKNSNERYNSKTFTFDNTFGADSPQVEIYREVVEPLIGQVVMGYNCTVFAYGQTGTGKTYTMEGERTVGDGNCSWADDPLAGIIPRALHQLFETLQTESAEHTVRVSFLELYNEELYDLLSSIDDTTKLKIFEDVTRKGSVIVGGLEEITVQSKAEIYDILRKGSAKRQTAATLLNACSSRSHTIFSVTVHIKENTIDGEDLVKIGKLNLVDLAGSENIGRSGAIDKRAREAGNINQSLLTLGRVITSLVDRTPHIPYRESKLTRLLQESLGGRTKTSIIATISPNICDADDTLSTLEYAQRAKKITNKPEINQKLSKKTLLREYTAEIERLRRDLAASREKNGIYVDEENFKQMEEQIKQQSQEITDKCDKIQALIEEMNKIQQLFDETKEELDQKVEQLEETKDNLEMTSKTLNETNHKLSETTVDLKEQKHLVEVHVKSEKELSNQAKQLLNVAEVTTSDVSILHQKVVRQKDIETNNFEKTNQFQQKFFNDMNELEELVSITTISFNDSLEEMQKSVNEKIGSVEDIVGEALNKVVLLTKSMGGHKTQLSSILSKDRVLLKQSTTLLDNCSQLKTSSDQSFDDLFTQVNGYQKIIDEIVGKMSETIAKQREEIENMVMKQNSHLKDMSKIVVKSFQTIKNDLKSVFENQNKEMTEIVAQMESSKASTSAAEQLIDKNIEEVIQSLNSIKAQRIKASLDFEDSSSLITNNVIEKTKNQMNCLKEFNTRVDGCLSEVECEVKVGLKFIESIDNINTENTQQLMDELNELNVQNQRHPNQTIESLNSGKEVITNQISESNKLVEDSIITCEKQLSAKQTALKEMDNELTEGLGQQKLYIESIVENMDHISSCVNDKTSEMVEMSQTLEKSQIREIENRFKSFETFVKNDLKKYIPTGSTPQKTDYTYPRDLVQTSPHQKILQRFRLIDACNTSLPEENESEVVSDSSPSSKSFDSNDENKIPVNDSQNPLKASLKDKSNSKLVSESIQTSSAEKELTSRRIVTPKPLSLNRNN